MLFMTRCGGFAPLLLFFYGFLLIPNLPGWVISLSFSIMFVFADTLASFSFTVPF